MKKDLKLFIILATTILSAYSFSNELTVTFVEATYVEGMIKLDTIWTLVDSPLVVSKDVIVCPNVTLTIEPGVEVKFGGNFSLIVEGRLVANGREDEMVTFTSNEVEAEAGDWEGIEFNGSQSSSLTYCIVKYGKNGLAVENGTVNIKESWISFNSESGVMVNDGKVEIRRNQIVNNTSTGIRITGGNEVIVENNTLVSNGDAITLTGNSTSGMGSIRIHQNKISFNTNSGILLEANTFNTTTIVNNELSANSYGFYIPTNSSTYLTHNYVSNNTVGFFYEEGDNHTAYFNDIYDNGLGMDVSCSAGVNATYNYWGDKSGPYHESLNPSGMGNPVGGDGVNLDFIFFLTASIDYNNTQPKAVLWADKTLVAVNQTVTLVGTDSHDDGHVDQYFFDFGDGNSSGWTTLSIFAHKYTSTGTYQADLKVKDDFGVESDNTGVSINVQEIEPLEASVALSDYTVNCDEQISVTVYVSDGKEAMENATVTLFSVIDGSFTPSYGLTNSTGHFTAKFTAPNVTEVTSVRIIARASEAGYAHGSDYKYLRVIPPLTIQMTAQPPTVKSEEKAVVTLYVKSYLGQPVSDALITLSSDQGNLSATVAITDVNGSATFDFTAPQTLSRLNVTLTASAGKLGYAVGYGEKVIAVEPKVLHVQATADSNVIFSEARSTITAHVTCDETPVPNVTVTLISDSGGNFSATTETTDADGNATFIFTAPKTTTELNVIITANATKNGYISDEGQTTLNVMPKVLHVQVTADPTIIYSEAESIITAYVTCDATPVPNVTVTLISDSGGNFSATTETTDADGNATFIFTAPKTTTELNVIITANATKNGYVNDQAQTTVAVIPKVLAMEVTADPKTTISEGEVKITAHVTYNTVPVPEANVTLASTQANFSATGLTDVSGEVTVTFTTPKVNSPSNITMVAKAAKDGYIGGQAQLQISVNPGELDVQVEVDETFVDSGVSTVVAVYVTCNGTPVEDASVVVSSTYGNFSVSESVTDLEGYCEFVFNASRTDEQVTASIVANATKDGYLGGGDHTAISVIPEEKPGGWPWMMILLMLIPIVIVVVVIVLVKLRILVFSIEEEE